MKNFSKKWLLMSVVIGVGISGCENPPPEVNPDAKKAPKPAPEIVSAQKAIQNADIPTIDPMPLDDPEVDKILPPTPRCRFSYTAASPAVLVTGMANNAATGVIKLHGKLVKLEGSKSQQETSWQTGTFSSGAITVEIRRIDSSSSVIENEEEQVPASMHFTLSQGLTVGYDGWLQCRKT